MLSLLASISPRYYCWIALLFGCLLPLSLAPYNYWYLVFFSIAAIYCLLNASLKSSAAAFRIGWFYGLGKYGIGISWVYVSIHEHGNAAPLLAIFLVAIFVAGMALFDGLFAWLYVRYLKQKKKDAWNPLIFSAARILLEWVLTWFLSGFPWLFVGYSQLDAPQGLSLATLAPIIGVLGVGLAVTLSAVYLARLLKLYVDKSGDKKRRLFGFVVLPWVLALFAGTQNWVERDADYSVALVQGNVDQASKWQQESVLSIIKNYESLSSPYWGSDLIIWPEAAITLFHHQAGGLITRLEKKIQGSLVLGIPAVQVNPDGSGSFQNTAIAIGSGEGVYIKRRLVPFGEYVPLESMLRGLIQFFNLPMSHSEPGSDRQPYLRTPQLNMAMAICYEIAYPELVRREGGQADVLLTISNDTWFGASIGPHQHLQMARMRALELGRFLLRATNNGITAIVDEHGQVLDSIPQFQAGVLAGHFYSVRGMTPYGKYGDSPLLLLLALLFIGALAFRYLDKNLSV